MESIYTPGIDTPEEQKQNEEAKQVSEVAARKPRPYTPWIVGGKEYKLKLTSSVIAKLEAKFKDSLLNVVLDKGIPPVSVTVTILQAACQKYQHGLRAETVEELYDEYIDDGHTQLDLLAEILLPLMGDAGFFTMKQLELMQQEMQTADQEL